MLPGAQKGWILGKITRGNFKASILARPPKASIEAFKYPLMTVCIIIFSKHRARDWACYAAAGVYPECRFWERNRDRGRWGRRIPNSRVPGS